MQRSFFPQALRNPAISTLLGLFLALFSLCASAAATSTGGSGAALPPALASQLASSGKARIILHLKTRGPGAANAVQAQDAVLGHLSALGITQAKRIPNRPFLALSANAVQLDQLRQDPNVIAIEEDRLLHPTLGSTSGVVGSPAAWDLGATGQDEMVAILDTGVDVDHDYFFGKTTLEACYSHNDSANGITPLCPNGGTSQTGPGAATPCSGLSGCDHGTHVAGIATGNGDAVGRPSGVAKDADLLAIQVFSQVDDPNACGSSNPCILAYDSDILSAMSYVQSQADTYPIVAVNLSLGGSVVSDAWSCDYVQTFGGNWVPSAMKQAVDDLRSQGIATVIAAGNDGNATGLSWPACISSAVSVGATDDGDSPAWFTNSASWMVVFAPGVSVDSSVPGNGYANMSGTSMATPQVTGALAALADRAADQGLNADIDNLIAALTGTGVPVTDSGNGMTFPRIQVDAAASRLDPAQILPAEVILDSDYDGAVTAGSFTGFSSSQAYRGLAKRGSGAGLDSFRFSPNLPQAGYYDVQAWWPAATGNSSQTQVDIVHAGGTSSLNLDQTTGGGRWNDLGTYYFNADGTGAVEFIEAGSGDLVVDAVRFILQDLAFTPLTLDTTTLADGRTGSFYSQQLRASGGTPPYTFTISAGSLPSGLTLDSATGAISGTPTSTGDFPFDASVSDSAGAMDTKSLAIHIAQNNSVDTVWVEDALPAGAVPDTNHTDEWNWISSNPIPYSGTLAHYAPPLSGPHQHYFYNATDTLDVGTGDVLFTYIYIDPANPPREVMLQWHTADGWEHRAYWGENLIDWGIDGPTSRHYMGTLPTTGQWVRLEVPAADVGLEGASLDGMAFTLYDGSATWDYAGVASVPAAPGVRFASATYSVNENGGSVSLSIERIGDVSNALSVDYATTDGTATAGQDYSAASGTLTFPAGDNTPQSISIPILDDSVYEGDETFTLALSNPVGASLATPSTATVSILDDEAPPTYLISGTITLSGNPFSGVTLSASTGASCTDSDASGTYSCSVPQGWSGTITPTLAGYDFTPPERTYTNVTGDQTAQNYSATATPEIVWIEDALPAGAVPDTNHTDEWNWISSNPIPYSGTLAHFAPPINGPHQHYFYNATDTLDVGTGDVLFTYIYIDPANPPREVMLQWHTADGWEHRAYWGENLIDWGIDGPTSRHYMGTLPTTGQWVRLEVPAADVGLEGASLDGMAFTLYDGSATWDYTGSR